MRQHAADRQFPLDSLRNGSLHRNVHNRVILQLKTFNFCHLFQTSVIHAMKSETDSNFFELKDNSND